MNSYTHGIYRGDTYRSQFALWADTEKTQPYDLTGVAVASWVVIGASITPFTVTVTDSVVDLVLTAAQCAALPVAAGRWDLQLTHPSGDVQTVVRGSVQVTADVTGAQAA